ncbi:hypothetical protein GCM10022254_62760 [Actinomadura meridiana]|uniref:DUF7691 domain-containing protein n=1 Tax=Actinomadura meridiana TaxID=559626 RepID=A0ABP8CJ84_9ACTN
MSTQLRLYSVSLSTLGLFVRATNTWLVQEGRARAAAMDAEGYVKATRTVTEALDDILHHRPKDPGAADAYGHAWEIVIDQVESKRFDFGPMRRGAQFLDEASRALRDLGVPDDLTPLGFMYQSPFTDTPHPAELPAIGHLPAARVADLLAACRPVAEHLTDPDHAALTRTILTAADEVADFNRFADGMADEDIPYCDLVTFYS